MVHQNALEQHGYAQLILVAYHSDDLLIDETGCAGYAQVTPLWDHVHVSLHEDLTGISPYAGGKFSQEAQDKADEGLRNAFDTLYPGLRDKVFAGKPYADYNNDPESMHDMNVFLVRASADDLLVIWDNMMQLMARGPEGADDTTFDYWPSAFGLWVHMGYDLIELGILPEEMALDSMRTTWEQAVQAKRGDGWLEQAEEFASEVTARP